jgi:gluconokinase
MTPYIIGIDIGTGSTKGVALNAMGNILYSTQVSYPTIHPQPGWHEQAPEIIWQAFIKCISRTVQELHGHPSAVSLSSAMHSLIPVNEKGEPMMNMMTWADKRSSSIAARIRHSASGEMLYEQTGTPIHAMSPLCKIIWLNENDQALFLNAHKFISIKEFIWLKLFDAYEIDLSIASASGLYDLEKQTWNDNALSLAMITTAKLSKLVSTSHIRKITDASVADQYNLSENTSFIIGASDGCLANLGSFATSPGVAALTIGTSGAIRVGSRKPTYNFQAMTFNYVLDEQTFISGGPVNNGGVALKWYVESFLKKSLNSVDDYTAVLSEIEMTEAGCHGLVFLPYLLGERAPIWNSETCGVFFGITTQHKQAHFTRAVVEGITFALYDVAQALEKSGLTINCINVSGGFVHSELWMQILCDIFNKKVCLVNPEDASALGAAYLALKATGQINDYDKLKSPNHKDYHPDPTQHHLYQQSFMRYKRLYNILQQEMSITTETIIKN